MVLLVLDSVVKDLERISVEPSSSRVGSVVLTWNGNCLIMPASCDEFSMKEAEREREREREREICLKSNALFPS